MNNVTTIGLDLAKNVFQLHGVDAQGAPVLRKRIRRADVLQVFAALPSCLVGMEACGSAHHWARELTKLGHTVKLMPAAYVKPYVKRGKTDAGDAEAIAVDGYGEYKVLADRGEVRLAFCWSHVGRRFYELA